MRQKELNKDYTLNNKEKALGLLIDTLKLYAAFCAIIIAGLLSFSASLPKVNCVLYLYLSIGILSFCSIFCIIGIQIFISKVYKGVFEIYSKPARINTIIVMLFLIIGLVFSFLFMINQDKLKLFNSKDSVKTELRQK